MFGLSKLDKVIRFIYSSEIYVIKVRSGNKVLRRNFFYSNPKLLLSMITLFHPWAIGFWLKVY